MDRTFHSKVDWWYWLLMAVTAFLLFDFFWFHYTIATLLVAALTGLEIVIVNSRVENNVAAQIFLFVISFPPKNIYFDTRSFI